MNKKILFIMVFLAFSFCCNMNAQGFRIYKNGAVIGTYTTEKFDSISFFQNIEYGIIDLGLPSGTLWADKNVGAVEMWENGYYVAWGETTEKNDYSLPNYKWCVFQDYENFYYTKYTQQDNLQKLTPEDDVASIIMGTEWSTPTQEEWEELFTYCTWQWATTHPGEKDGYVVIGPNGRGLFLPASGRIDQTINTDLNMFGCYWTTNRAGLLSGKEIYAYEFYFSADFKKIANTNREAGLTVRAVKRK
jgi:hypothetical protein